MSTLQCSRCHGDCGWSGRHGVWEPCPDCDSAECWRCGRRVGHEATCPDAQPADLCNECNLPVSEDDAGPSCGAHILHVECAPWFGCTECYLMRAEIP